MAEAEDVITDAALHVTNFVQRVWRAHRAKTPHRSTLSAAPTFADVAPRLDLLIVAVFGRAWRLRMAPVPARTTWLAAGFRRRNGPHAPGAIPATDGVCIWLPLDTGLCDAALALQRFRTVALQQAMRAYRGSAGGANAMATPLERDLYLLLEAHAADAAIARLLPGIAEPLNVLRRAALAVRPALSSFAAERRPFEIWVRQGMARPCTESDAHVGVSTSPRASRRIARELAWQFVADASAASAASGMGSEPLFKDWWTGELHAPGTPSPQAIDAEGACSEPASKPIRSARLTRRPEVRESALDEDDAQPGAWMVQASAPHEIAADPFGLQRPTDRDEQTAADEFAELLAELDQARLVRTPERPREVLWCDDPPDVAARRGCGAAAPKPECIAYPEWDHRLQAYRDPGASVVLVPAPAGPKQWVDDTLAEHRSMLDTIRRRFEMLRAQRTLLRRQDEGDEIDLEACIDAQADWRAGLPMAQALYRSQRRSRRDIAILLLIDTSGSTDAWVSHRRRVIDVEREALLLVCIALGAMGEPYAVQAFSGEGPQSVSVRTLKRFDEPYGDAVATRIAALEPEQYTRAGAAMRHAAATLMQQRAAHRLLLLLSDGKPNDVDVYAGRYGVEDMRRAVIEATLLGIAPFCLTVDRHAASYLAAVFGANRYAMLRQPAMLPSLLLDWMQRLVRA